MTSYTKILGITVVYVYTYIYIYVGGCKNYGPLLGPHYLGDPRVTNHPYIYIYVYTHVKMFYHQQYVMVLVKGCWFAKPSS